ncbi:hypothetical protein C8J57DRAFT_1169018 [Mycena rebaudengoi]|nr:hypothetical protein C8J57DRAFT_1169018 [Mycena rebaudengoi]
MHFSKAALLVLFPRIGTVFSVPSSRSDSPGTISSPVEGQKIAPGEEFDFSYNTMADYGISSYNFNVYVVTEMPTPMTPSIDFAHAHFFGHFAELNYPGNPRPKNLAPTKLTMPDFSKGPGGWANGEASVANRITFAMTGIVYNTTPKL